MLRSVCRQLLPLGGHGLRARAAPSTSYPLLHRWFATIDDCQDEIDKINQLFVEARDEIDYAKEDAETVYFNDSVKEAVAAVGLVLQHWDAVLAKLDDEQKKRLQRSMGLKMEQLKAELEQLDHLHS